MGWRAQYGVQVLLLLAVLSGCATVQTVSPAAGGKAVTVAPASEPGWWYARFRFNWPEGEDPAWYADLWVAREVVEPVLTAFRGDIRLWRFHRRARRDNAGHQFSFIFYATPDVAERIFVRFRESRDLEQLKARKLVLKDSYDSTGEIKKPHIEDTSDPHWSEPLQKAWPYFIMGVSRSWLDLVDRLAAATESEKKGSADDPEAFYRQVNRRLVKLWQEEGGHAFIHHLSAIFGYESTYVYERRLMRF